MDVSPSPNGRFMALGFPPDFFWGYLAASQNVQPDPYPEPTGRSITPIHTKTQVIQTDPYVRITAGGSIPEFWGNSSIDVSPFLPAEHFNS